MDAQLLADKLQPLIMLIDNFIIDLDDDEIELLKKSKNILKDHINMKESAVTLAYAFGIETNTMEEKHKLKTLEILIDLIDERKWYRNDLLKHIEHEKTFRKNKQELMNMFENL